MSRFNFRLTPWQRCLLLITGIAFVARFFCSGMRIFVSPDSMAYWHTAQALLEGQWQQTYIERTPGYPAFILLTQSISQWFAAQPSQLVFQKCLLFLQSLLGIGNALLMTETMKTLLNKLSGLNAPSTQTSLSKAEWIAVASGVAMALWPDFLLYEHAFLSETLYTTTLLIWFWYALCRLQSNRWASVLILGMLTGWLLWIKPIALAVALCGAGYLWWQRTAWIKNISIYIACIGLWMLPWMFFNLNVHHMFTFAAGKGANQLYKMIDAVDWSSPLEAEYKLTLKQRYLLYPDGSTYNAVNDVHVLMDQAAKRKPDYSSIYLKHDEAAGKLAWEGIHYNPQHWVFSTARQWLDFFIKAPVAIVAKPIFSTWANLSWQFWQLLGYLSLCGFAVALSKKRAEILLASGLIMSHATFYALSTLADARYRIPLIPFALILAGYAIAMLWIKAPEPQVEAQSSPATI